MQPFMFYEFFAGGGMARMGLGHSWKCLFANDFSPRKVEAYRAYFGQEAHLVPGDVAKLHANNLPDVADLAWGSFPCQDLSLAGAGAGLAGARSGTFWPFMDLMKGLRQEGRQPHLIVLENVCGAITAHDGRDLSVILQTLRKLGYRYGPVVLDAESFLPQSRPRLFIVAVEKQYAIPSELKSAGPTCEQHPDSFGLAYELLSKSERADWIWWRLPKPPKRRNILADIIEETPSGVIWHTEFETKRLLEMMSPVNRAKVEEAKSCGVRKVGGLYRRTRTEKGVKRQRAEVRFDDVAGCLRTPGGGSSRQTILIVEGQRVRSRLLSPREAARLMGLPEDYPLPKRYNDAYKLAGDGVAVPVVRHLAKHLLEPLLKARRASKEAA